MRPNTLSIRFVAFLTLMVFGAAGTANAQFIHPKKSRRTVAPTARPPARKSSNNPANRKAQPRKTAPRPADSLMSSLALQLRLEQAWFSPGIIDGSVGSKTLTALAAFQMAHHLPPSGELDDASRNLLRIDDFTPTRTYKLTKADASRVGPCPTDWIERSEAERMPFRSLIEVLAYEGHCTHALIARLNPDIDINQLALGQTLVIPNVLKPERVPQIRSLEIEFENKRLLGRDTAGNVVTMFYCSIARQRADRPEGDCEVKAIAVNPVYTFRPESWPEVKGIDRALRIPPGPRNPVGLCWIDLTIDGYGIHGTPDPEMIGKTGSHGCIRLTNWDVLRVAKLVHPGMKVALVQGDRQMAAAPNE